MSGAAVERYTFCRDHFAECACDLEPHQNGDYVSFGDYEDTLLREATLTARVRELEAALRELVGGYFGNSVPSDDIDAMYERARAALANSPKESA